MEAKLEKRTGSLSSKFKTLDSFKVPQFRLFFIAQAGGLLGYNMLMIANPLLLYRLTGSAFLMGVMGLASCIPVLLLSLLGGTIADRIQKKYILFASRLGMALIALIIALALSIGFLSKEHAGSYWVLISCTLLNGIFFALISPALISIVPELVGKDRVMNGISLNNLGSSIFMFISPGLAGFLIDLKGFLLVFYLIVIFNVISAILMVFLPRSNTTNVTAKRSTMGDMLDSFKYIGREPILLVIFIIIIFHYLGSAGYTQLSAVFTESILKVSATKLGLMSSIGSLAAILTSFIMASLPGKKRGVLFLISNLIVGAAMIFFAASRWYYLSIIMVFLTNMGVIAQMTLSPTLIQTYAEEKYRARMQGAIYMASGLGNFGGFFAGALSEAIGIQWAVGGLAGLLFVITIIFWTFNRQLRRLD